MDQKSTRAAPVRAILCVAVLKNGHPISPSGRIDWNRQNCKLHISRSLFFVVFKFKLPSCKHLPSSEQKIALHRRCTAKLISTVCTPSSARNSLFLFALQPAGPCSPKEELHTDS